MTLHDGVEFSDKLKKKLVATVRSQIGAFAAPDAIHLAPGERNDVTACWRERCADL